MTRSLPTLWAIALALIVLAAVVARAVPASREPLWLDEVVSARIITQSTIGDAVVRVRKTESSPPGWHLGNWLLWRAAGSPSKVERLRFLSVALGALLTMLVFFYGLSIGLSRLGAAVAGGLLAVGPNVVAHGAELRPYELLTLLALVFAFALERAANTPSRMRLSFLALVVVVGCYTHYFFLLSLATGIAWSLVRLSGRKRLQVIGAMVAGTVPFLVWLPSFLSQYRHNLYAYNGSFSVRAVAYSYTRVIGILGETGVAAALVRLLFAAAVVIGAALLFRTRRSELAALFTTVPVALTALLWLLGPHIFNERNLLISAPFAALSVGLLVTVLPRQASLVLLLALVGVVGVSLWQWEIDYGRSSYDRIAQVMVHSGWHQDDEIVQFGPAPLGLSQPVGWYLPGHPTLVRARTSGCGHLFAVSYDTGTGARWIRQHASRSDVPHLFTAYDHTPRGPQARTPIVVARVSRDEATAKSAVTRGARLLHSASARCGG